MHNANIIVLGLQLACMVQLKGNLTHTDTVHANYWLKAHSLINTYLLVREEKPANIILQKATMLAKRALQRVFKRVNTFPSVIMYIHM